MAFGSLEHGGDNEPLAEINMVPLIDVMLVLLVIFMVTAPLLTHAVKLDLPRAGAQANPPAGEKIELAIDAGGQSYWNGEALAADAIDRRLAAAAAQKPLPELQLRAERATAYEKVAQLLAAAARHGLSKISFVTDPRSQ